MTERIFRCAKCGKWSHAQRRPTWHKRTLMDGPPADHNGWDGTPARRVAWASGYRDADVIEEVEAAEVQTEVDDFHRAPGYVVVRCGPFETWEAAKVEEAPA